MTTNNYTKKSPSPPAADYKGLMDGDKVVVVGGTHKAKVGYKVGETSCHYRLLFLDGGAGEVWRQNVRLLNSDNKSEQYKRAPERNPEEEKAELERKLNRALKKLSEASTEIDDLFRRLTGTSTPDYEGQWAWSVHLNCDRIQRYLNLPA
jgi:hypothetical protein